MKPTPPKKPIFPDRAYAEGRGPRISAARRSLWEQFPEQLAELDAGALEFNDLPCDSVSWVEYYEAHLRRLRREALSDDDPTDVDLTPPTTSPEIAPKEELALWYRTERERIKSTNRSILIANDELKDLQAEYQRRKRALREGPS